MREKHGIFFSPKLHKADFVFTLRLPQTTRAREAKKMKRGVKTIPVNIHAKWFKCRICGAVARARWGKWLLMCEEHLCLTCLNKKLMEVRE